MFQYNPRELMNSSAVKTGSPRLLTQDEKNTRTVSKAQDFDQQPDSDQQSDFDQQPDSDQQSDFDQQPDSDQQLDSEETKGPPYVWKVDIFKQWASPVLTEQEYIEMKKASNRDDDIEQDSDGYTMQEKYSLAKSDDIQNARKRQIPFDKVQSLKYEPSISHFYILPKHKKHYIRLSLGLQPNIVTTK